MVSGLHFAALLVVRLAIQAQQTLSSASGFMPMFDAFSGIGGISTLTALNNLANSLLTGATRRIGSELRKRKSDANMYTMHRNSKNRRGTQERTKKQGAGAPNLKRASKTVTTGYVVASPCGNLLLFGLVIN